MPALSPYFLQVVLPACNACLNATSALCLGLGYVAIRRGQRARHRRLMLSAVSASSLFLVGYLSRVALAGTHRLQASGALKVAYLLLLGSHMVLAVVLLPLVLVLLRLALTGRFAAHRRLAVWTWPIWMYVSCTGVLVYAVLYHLAPALA